MAYGLKVRNDKHQLVIDGTYENWCTYETGSVSFDKDDNPKAVTFSTPTPNEPLIALQPITTYYTSLYRITQSGGNYTGFKLLIDTNATSSQTIKWAAFTKRTIGSESYGMRVRNAKGNIVYDTQYAPMRISSVDTFSHSFGGGARTISHPEDANAYHVHMPQGVWTVVESAGEPLMIWWIYYGGLCKKDNDEVYFDDFVSKTTIVPYGGPGSYGYWPSSWSVMTIKEPII